MTVTHEIPSYDPPKKLALVLSCVDFRLLDDIVNYLHIDNMTNRYYHFALAGASMGLTDAWKCQHVQPTNYKKPASQRCQFTQEELETLFSPWRQTFVHQFQAAMLLTDGKISDVYIIQHQHCGAYQVYLDRGAENWPLLYEQQVHKQHAEKLRDEIKSTFDTLAKSPLGTEKLQLKAPEIHNLFMDLRGHVVNLDTVPSK
ncbi:MAG: hypothetical protein C0478_08815 [Planctomyces sp.]|nr:hypothetical protein [Planctomyces sp.]